MSRGLHSMLSEHCRACLRMSNSVIMLRHMRMLPIRSACPIIASSRLPDAINLSKLLYGSNVGKINRRKKIRDDPGSWEYSPEWWGTQSNGWGRDAGDIVFQEKSTCGNGDVTVTGHASSAQKADVHSRPSDPSVICLGHEWRVLRFNTETRQSVSRVAFMEVNAPGREPQVASLQQANCLAFEYLKTSVSAGLAAASLSGLSLDENDTLEHQPIRVLCIGLGGGSLPLFLASHLPGSLVDAVELDPVVIRAATQAMGFPAGSIRQGILPGNTSFDAQTGGSLEVESRLWGDLASRVSLYEYDGAQFVCDRVNSHGWGWSLDEDGVQRGHGYNLVFVDAYDGNDKVPFQLRDPEGPFLKCLRKILHPDHGTVVVNLHGDLPPASLIERLTGRKGPGFDPKSYQGKSVLQTCLCYSDALLDLNPEQTSMPSYHHWSGESFTVTTRNQGNVVLVVSRQQKDSRSNFLPPADNAAVIEAVLQGKKQKKLVAQLKAICEELPPMPFDVSRRAVQSLHRVEDIIQCVHHGLL